ncbi:MAG TPA: type II toxin-antitoxin system VapC family toxin [Terriglobia bacterium]|nr:type II toxin-antitoxin system VapC family toxin [Terriglobia bacterium]
MRAIDANVLVRLLVQDDPQQVAAARRWVEGGAWVSTLALAEAVWFLSVAYDRGPNEIGSAIETLLDHRDLTLQDPDVVAAALVRFRERPSVGFSDCLLLELARQAGHLPLGTFDRNLSKLNGAQKL